MGVDRLLEMSVREGNVPAGASDDPLCREMSAPMSEAIRAAGEQDSTLAYAQTLDADPPMEGFIDEARGATIMFPFPPEVVAAARSGSELNAATSRICMAALLGAIGLFGIYRGVMLHGGDDGRLFVGVTVLMGAVLLYRRAARRRAAMSTEESD